MSYQMRIKPHRMAGAIFVTEVRDALLSMLMRRKKEDKLKQADIARILEVDRSVVNRQLTGKADLSLMRVGELAEILGCVAEFRLVSQKREHANHADEAFASPAGKNITLPALNPAAPLVQARGSLPEGRNVVPRELAIP